MDFNHKIKIFFGLCIFALIGLYLPDTASAESINNYSVKLDIVQSGEVIVTERIQYNFENSERHGIFRHIPYTKSNAKGEKFMLGIKEITVTDETGLPYQFQVTTSGDQKEIKIGDPNSYVRGIKNYIISYNVSGALTYFENFDELYWNAIGTDWSVPIKSAVIEITLPEKISDHVLTNKCYTGISGSTDSECRVTVASFKDLTDRSITKTRINYLLPRSLNAYEGLTIVTDFPKNVVSILEPTKYRMPLAEIFWIVFFGILCILWYIVYPIKAIFKYLSNRKNVKAKQKILTADYDIPRVHGLELSPAQVGLLSDKTIGKEDLTATIIDLARRGYFKIKVEEVKDWNPFTSPEKISFIANKSNLDNKETDLKDFEKTLINDIFDDKITDEKGVESSEVVKNFTKKNTINHFDKDLGKSIKSLGLSKNDIIKTRDYYSGIGVFAAVTFNLLLAVFSFRFGRFGLELTDEGIEAYSCAESLKNFLKTQDRQLNFQSKNQYWFEKLLPYATSFKVEDVWMDRVKDLHVKTPDWIDTRTSNFTTFNLINSISNSVGTVHAASNNSSSGFRSGSSGGFSGGGGGGGGGGSW